MTIYRHRITGPGPAGDVWVTTLHTSSSQSLSAVHTAFGGFITGFVVDVLVPMWPAAAEMNEYATDQLDPVTGHNVAQQITTVTHVGSGAGQALPQNVALVTGLRTLKPTKAGRGRMYWPAPSATHLSATGELSSVDANTLAAGMAGALNSLAATATPCVYHRASKTFDAVTSVTVGQNLGVQRRRVNKVPNDYVSQAL